MKENKLYRMHEANEANLPNSVIIVTVHGLKNRTIYLEPYTPPPPLELESNLAKALSWAVSELDPLNDETKQLQQIYEQLPFARKALEEYKNRQPPLDLKQLEDVVNQQAIDSVKHINDQYARWQLEERFKSCLTFLKPHLSELLRAKDIVSIDLHYSQDESEFIKEYAEKGYILISRQKGVNGAFNHTRLIFKKEGINEQISSLQTQLQEFKDIATNLQSNERVERLRADDLATQL